MTRSTEFWSYTIEGLAITRGFYVFFTEITWKLSEKNVSKKHRYLLTKLSTDLIEQDEQTHSKSFGIRAFNVNIKGECEYVFSYF